MCGSLCLHFIQILVCFMLKFSIVHSNDHYPYTRSKLFKVATIHSPPFIYYDANQGIKATKGYLIDLLHELQKEINFDYELYLVEDGLYGHQLPNGTWIGLVGELVTKRADLALAALTITRQRLDYIEFTEPYMHTGISMMYKLPAQGAKLPFYTVNEMIHTDLMYGPMYGGSTHAFFNNTRYALYEQMMQRMRQWEEKFPRTMEDAVRMVRHEGFVYLGESPMIDYFLGQEPCDLMRFGGHLNEGNYALGGQRSSGFTDDFTRAMVRLREEGVLSRLYNSWWTDRNQCLWGKKNDLCVCSTGDKVGLAAVTVPPKEPSDAENTTNSAGDFSTRLALFCLLANAVRHLRT